MKKRILIIEDRPEHREDARKIFSELESEVEIEYARSFMEGVEKLDLSRDRKDFLKKMVGDIYVDVEFYDKELKHEGRYDGVITDLYMPVSTGFDPTITPPEPGTPGYERYLTKKHEAEEIPAGAILAGILDKVNLPFVICTAGYHHGAKYDYVCTLARMAGWGELVDGNGDEADGVGEAKSKAWRRAYENLKVKMERAGAQTPPAKITSSEVTGTTPEKTKKILIGDDQLGRDDEFEKLRRSIIEKDYSKAFAGFSLEYVADPRKFIELAKSKEYEVLMIDLKWGSEELATEGYHILDEVKDCAPVRILWTSEDEEARQKGYEHCATHCIGKSPHPEELEKILNKDLCNK